MNLIANYEMKKPLMYLFIIR